MFTQKTRFSAVCTITLLSITLILTSVLPQRYITGEPSYSEAAPQNEKEATQDAKAPSTPKPELAPAVEVEEAFNIPDASYEKAGAGVNVSVVTEGAVDILPSSESKESSATEDAITEAISGLDVIEKGDSYTVFQKSDGTRVLNSFSGDIRYRDKKGRVHDYDNSIVPIPSKDKASEKGKYAFKNGRGNVSVLFPSSLETGEPIKVANDTSENAFEMQPLTEVQADELNELSINIAGEKERREAEEKEKAKAEEVTMSVNEGESSPATSAAAVTAATLVEEQAKILSEGIPSGDDILIVKKEETDLYGNREEKKSSIIYPGAEDGISYEYMPIDGGVKENIILSGPPKSNTISFYVKHEGAYAKISAAGSILFFDKKTSDEVGVIMAPYMNDSNAEGSYNDENLRYSISETGSEDGSYIVTLTVDRSYLDSKERKYPVIIDPSYSYSGSSMTESQVQDVYIISAAAYDDINFWDSGIRKMIVGYHSTEHVRRTLIKFPGLQALISKNYVTKATLKLKEVSNNSPRTTTRVQPIRRTALSSLWNIPFQAQIRPRLRQYRRTQTIRRRTNPSPCHGRV